MAEIIMPKMGDAMTEGKVVRWYKKAGDAVKKGEPVLEIETDKVNLDLEAEQDGTVGEITAQEGEKVEVGGRLATILGAGEKAPASAPATAPAPEQQRRVTDKKDSVKHTTGEYAEAIETKGPRRDRTETTAAARPPHSTEGRQRSSPLARRMARDLGVDLQGMQGSGPGGRIVAKDIQGGGQAPRLSGQAGAPVLHGEDQQIPLSAMRRTIAKRLSESIGPIPHFFLTADYDVTNLLGLRAQIEEKTSVNDFLIRAVALALRKHPNVNASWGEEAITQHGGVHIGVAVATPEGLITPVVRDADRKTVLQIAQEVRALAEKAKNRKLLPNEYQGSTFTISNLGAWGIEEFTAIINPPNVAILAVGTAEPRAVVQERQIVIRDRMKVTMSCDHRVVDGALGADFLKTLRQFVEQPVRLLL
jgi:pyruvate dehydrogenase E2 component (dihydrolipoamide acetyltransferase)